MDRREFLKKSGIGLASLAILSKFGIKTEAATVNDNLVDGTYVKGATAPSDTSKLWVDTSANGVVKYWDGSAWRKTGAGVIGSGSSGAGTSRGSATVPVYVDEQGETKAVTGIDGTQMSVFKIPVNPTDTSNINIWIET